MLLIMNKILINILNKKINILNRRQISALYITRDKANEHYVTLQPYMNFDEKFANVAELRNNINHRKLNINLNEILIKYKTYNDLQAKVKELETQRENLTTKLKKLLKSNNSIEECNSLKEQGKVMRNELKTLKETFYPIEDDFMHSFLNLPNELHTACPEAEEKILYNTCKGTYENASCHLKRKDLIDFIDENRYYLHGDAAMFDLRSMQIMLQYFVENAGFLPIANPDFVRCVLIEANATPLSHYHQVVEENLQNKINNAYLTGGGAFESFLGALTKLSVYPSALPFRWISSGRNYQKLKSSAVKSTNLFNATQTNAVQTLVATTTQAEANNEMEMLLNLLINFYTQLNLPFRLVYTNASKLLAAESRRATIEVYSPQQKCYISLGHVSDYGNFVSKRILFNTRDVEQYKFPYILGGPILLTSRLIGALIEHNIPLQNCQLEKLLNANGYQNKNNRNKIVTFN